MNEEQEAMNIVYQISDLLNAPVDVRQANNDRMIDFTKGFLDRAYQAGQADQKKRDAEIARRCTTSHTLVNGVIGCSANEVLATAIENTPL